MRVNSSMSPGLGNAAESTPAPRDQVIPAGPPSPLPAWLDHLPQGGTRGWPGTERGRCSSLSSVDPCGAGGAPLRCLSQLRVSAGPLDAFRRHSWEPGKEEQYCPHYKHHSVSLERLDPEGMDRVMGGSVPRSTGRDPRRNPIIHNSEMLDSLTSLLEESEDFLFLQDHADRLQAYSCSAPSLCVTLSDMERTDQDPDEISLYSEGGSSTLSVNAEGDTGSVLDLSSSDYKPGSPLNRTLSFFKKMAGKSKVGLESN
ncbi:uncharacterized protein LOC121307013 [Polyodon spathula]|uniref:uncharacterized protein LOC121307013 n=1 Tax=Polyodon spathula TaxID=7913 RepID=UPI001B7EA523|nr:uncharacterized protein LOC121307013 [Polyodon spathula]XP_041095016.1 uncharacterized protein LOC121307013 [Polyodon spathula]